ncbi:MAG: ComF family protein [bacterium]
MQKLINSSQITLHKHKRDFIHLSESFYFDRIITLWPYIKIIESLIHQIKYHHRKKLGFFLGKIAGRLLHEELKTTGEEVIIPVPLHKIRYRERGYNQSSLLAQGISEYIKLPIYEQIMVRIKNTKSQTTLNAQQRSSNLKNAFSVTDSQKIHNKTIFLVDDVSTTGATLNSCSRTLKKAGVEKIIGLAMARPGFHVMNKNDVLS